MTTKLKEVDVVIVGLGWTGGFCSKELTEGGLKDLGIVGLGETGGILAKELTEGELKVVALESGALRSSESDYSLPNIRDELRYVVCRDLMQKNTRDTIT